MRLPDVEGVVPIGYALAAAVVLLFVLAILAWIGGRTGVAGVLFLLASIAIYYRETRT